MKCVFSAIDSSHFKIIWSYTMKLAYFNPMIGIWIEIYCFWFPHFISLNFPISLTLIIQF